MDTSNSLEYSCCNEDSRSELRALQPKGRRVLSIAASGGRAFSLLLGDPREVVALDVNQQQIHLCLLKYHAIKQLSRREYLAFVGVGSSNDRLNVYSKIRTDLPACTQTFWDNNTKMVSKGIIYAGRFDRHVIRLAKIGRFFTWWPFYKLRSFKTVEEQAKYVLSGSRRTFWTFIFKCLFNPRVSKVMHKVMYLDVGSKECRRHAGLFFLDRLVTYLCHNLFRDSHFLQLFSQGRLTIDGPLPLHLQRGNYELVRQRLGRLSFQYCNIIKYLENHSPNLFDAFSLSDVGSYLDDEQMALLLSRVEGASTHGALICLREYVAPLDISTAWCLSFRRNRELEEELAKDDKCFGYTFICAEVEKDARLIEAPDLQDSRDFVRNGRLS